MKIKPLYLLNVVLTIVLLTSVFANAAINRTVTAETAEYDSWKDINEDGKVNLSDLIKVATGFGTSGDPTKNVNVTNWPIERETFPKNLLLRGTMAKASTGGYPWDQRYLVDQDTPYANPDTKSIYSARYDFDYKNLIVNTTYNRLLYQETFVYEKIPTKSYQILGMPTVSLTFNVSYSTTLSNGQFQLDYYATLGQLSTAGTWTPLVYMGVKSWGYLWGTVTNQQTCEWFNAHVFDPITVDSYQRIALRIEIRGWLFGSGSTTITLKTLFGMNTNQFLVSIPIVENP